MNILDILKQLISIPSYVDSRYDDSTIAGWIFNYLKKCGVPVEKQFVTDERMNILAYSSSTPELLVAGHLDTVRPPANWPTAATPIEKNGKLYGLGASDMKAGLAAMLSVLANKKPKNALFLFYGDEEYDFLGMKKFVKSHRNKIKPKLIISMDGENLQIGNCCRGLIETTLTIRGEASHSTNPKLGINAITGSLKAMKQLESWIKSFKKNELGASTINVAAISGGTMVESKNGIAVLSREGNVIPDYCELVLEVRPSTPALTLKVIIERLRKLLRQQRLKLEKIATRHNLGSWITPKRQLGNVLKTVPNQKLVNPMGVGYTDAQMLWEAFGKVPTFSFGPAEPNTAHKINEFVRIDNVRASARILDQVAQKFV